MTIHHFDAKGMKCPLPVLKARKLMKDRNGDVEVHTDPGAPGDQHFCETTGHQLLIARQRTAST
jgi:tRNA 2-thiouridine synthesizing protein A